MQSHETKAEARKAVKAIFDEKFTAIPTEKSSSKLSKDILSARGLRGYAAAFQVAFQLMYKDPKRILGRFRRSLPTVCFQATFQRVTILLRRATLTVRCTL